MSCEKQAIIAKKRELIQRYEKEILAGPNSSDCEAKLLGFRKLLNEMEKNFWERRGSQEEEIHKRSQSEEVKNTVWKQTSQDTESRANRKRRFSMVDQTSDGQKTELKSSIPSPKENHIDVIVEDASLEPRRTSVTAISPTGLKIKLRLI